MTLTSWSMAPVRCFTLTSAGLRPNTFTLPSEGSSRPSSIASVVVLPAPLGPSTAVIEPRLIVKLTCFTACFSWKLRLTLFISITCSIVYPSVSFCPLGYIAIVPETGEKHQYGLSLIQSDNCHPATSGNGFTVL